MFATTLLFWFLTLVLPVLLIYLGIVRMFKCKEMKAENGYFSKISLSSQQAWDVAQKLCAKRYTPLGIIMTTITVAVNILQNAQTQQGLLLLALMIVLAQAAVSIFIVASVGMSLQKQFH